MKPQRQKPGYGNGGKTNYVFPPFPQPLRLLTNYEKKQRPKNNYDRLHKILDATQQLGARDSALRAPARDSKGDLHDQRHRVAEHVAAQSDQSARLVSQR